MGVADFVQAGNSVDYTPAAAIAAGAVVNVGSLIGVAASDIAANELGAIAMSGVFDFDKSTAGGSAITFGTDVYWDSGAGQATATATANTLIGKCVKAAADADAKVRVRLSQ